MKLPGSLDYVFGLLVRQGEGRGKAERVIALGVVINWGWFVWGHWLVMGGFAGGVNGSVVPLFPSCATTRLVATPFAILAALTRFGAACAFPATHKNVSGS